MTNAPSKTETATPPPAKKEHYGSSFRSVQATSAIALAGAGWLIGTSAADAFSQQHLIWRPPFTAGGLILGYFAPAILLAAIRAAVIKKVEGLPLSTLIAGGIGFFVGLMVAALLTIPLSYLPGRVGDFTPLGASVLVLIIMTLVFVSRERDLMNFLRITTDGGTGPNKIILDTSAIIDGRIADIVQTGFIHDTLVVPKFVLEELQQIADSRDSLRRARGRRGLEILNKLGREDKVPMMFPDSTVVASDVDGKLVALAREMRAALLTTDFNLNRVASIQGVKVLDMNDLAHALRPILQPGEEMRIQIVQEGKESGQGVGFLDDGTMVVIENGKRLIGEETDVSVTRVLQTNAGRIVFAQLKG